MPAIDDDKYLRERIKPLPGDPLYLSLSDLLLALQNLCPSNVSRVLDYGCGGSPYRPLFKNCVYHRADIGGQDLDYQYGSDSRLPVEDDAYDLVLSTQVLEHVEDPALYLMECHRILKQGGRLLLTTHGVFEDHACPFDYWRWTAFGLQKLIERHGFKVDSSVKVTTGPRAAMFLAERLSGRFEFASGHVVARSWKLGLRLMRRFGTTPVREFAGRRLHKMADSRFAKNRVVDAGEAGHGTYIGVGMLASRV
jgi:SAM-dependent methyltransferase